MADANTTLLNAVQPEVGASDNSWGDKLNAALAILDGYLRDLGGDLVSTGSATAYEIAANGSSVQALKDGLRFMAKMHAANTTAAPTLTYTGASGFAAKVIRKQGIAGDIPLAVGDISLTGMHEFDYIEHGNSAAGAWLLLNPNLGHEAKANQLCPHANLVVKWTSVTQVTVVAEHVTLFAAGGKARRFSSISEVAAITTAGAGGLDTGAEASSTWYSIFLIAKEDGTFDALLSAVDGGKGPAGGAPASTPTLPSGYVYWGFVGSVYNNSASDFLDFYQVGNRVIAARKNDPLTISGNFANYSLAAVVPPEATVVHFGLEISATGGSYPLEVTVILAPSGTTTTAARGEQRFVVSVPAASAVIEVNGACVLETAQQIAYRTSPGRIPPQTPSHSLHVSGWSY